MNLTGFALRNQPLVLVLVFALVAYSLSVLDNFPSQEDPPITVREAGGDVYINDGSGSIDVRGVTGSVTVDDGSGSIDVSDVDEDLIIVDDGSGGLDFSNIGGRIEKET